MSTFVAIDLASEVMIGSLRLGLVRQSQSKSLGVINQDGRLNVSAIDLTAGGSIDVEFQTEAVMNAE